MARSYVVLALLVTGCGDAFVGGGLGEPIFRVNGVLTGEQIPDPRGELRALFGWLSYGSGPFVDCVETEPFYFCGPRVEYDSKLTLTETAAIPVFPNGVLIPFWTFPEESQLLEHEGSRLAIGGFAIYDDVNGNGKLDPINAEPIDDLVAESVITKFQSAVIFREGPVHPLWSVVRGAFGCPDPPLGYSVARVFGLDGAEPISCRLSPVEELVITRSDNERTDRVLCGGPLVGFNLGLDLLLTTEQPVAPLPENAAGVECLTNGTRVSYFVDEGHYCDRYEEKVLALEGCDPTNPLYCWDLRDDPPEWWPCAL